MAKILNFFKNLPWFKSKNELPAPPPLPYEVLEVWGSDPKNPGTALLLGKFYLEPGQHEVAREMMNKGRFVPFIGFSFSNIHPAERILFRKNK